MAERVLGFAVSDKEGNLYSLFEKRVGILEEFENKEAVVIIAIKEKKQGTSNLLEIRNSLNGMGFNNYLDINQIISQ